MPSRAPTRHKKLPARQLAALYEASPTLVYLRERVGEGNGFALAYVSPAFERTSGWSSAEFLSDADFWIGRIHPDDRHAVLAGLEDLLQSDEVVQEYRFRHKAGYYLWLRDTVRIERDDAGEAIRQIGFCRDLTRRRELESAHRESEQRYRIVIEGMTEAVAMRDSRGYLVFANQQYFNLLGYAPEELLDTALDKVTAPERRGAIDALLAARREGGGEKYETILIRKDGQRLHTLMAPRAMFNDSGEFIGSCAIITDVTENRRTEAALADAREIQHAEIERRKLIELKLREREERLRRIVDNLMDGLIVIDETGLILDFNIAASRMFGYEREEAIGADVGILMPSDQSFLHDRALARYLETGKATIIGIGPREVLARRRDGTPFPAEIAISEVNLGGQRRFVGAIRDQTERKRVEEALLASEAGLANAQRMAQMGNWEWDIASGETRWSDGLCRIFGFPTARKPRSYEETTRYFHPEDRERVDGIIRNCVKEIKSAEFEHRIIRDTGELRYLHIIVEVVSDVHGKPVLLIGVCQDVTERKRQEKALRESERRFREFAESLPEIVFESDARGLLTFLNRKGLASLGYSHEDVCRGIPVSSLVAPQERERADRKIMEISAGRDIGPGEFSGWRKDGSLFSMMVHASAVYREGRFAGLRGMVIDISERKAVEEALIEAKRAAEWADHAKTEFLANMSHELRTPLNAIIGFSEIIKSETMGPVGVDRYLEYANDINESGEHLLSLINDMLDLSKIEAGASELDEEQVDIPGIFRSVTNLIGPRADRDGIEVYMECPEDMPLLLAEKRKIKQIFVNLLSNAIKFSKAGDQVTLMGWWRDGLEMAFRVTDCGMGIAKEDIPRALAPFQQVGSQMSRTHEGTGLGLPLSKALVEMHGGTLDLQSDLGVGTTVTVRFPAERIVTVKKNPSRKAG